MAKPILIYGANGFSGKRIAEVAARWKVPDVILGGRNGKELKTTATRHGFDFRAFALDDPDEVRRGLRGVGVVLNAAGPFVKTADRLARSAIAVESHYVDITGELDVYRRLDDLHRIAESRNVALVSGAGMTGAVSNYLIAKAMKEGVVKHSVRAVRIAFSSLDLFSRGSVATAWRSMREQVLVVRPRGTGTDASAIAFVPHGSLVRKFAFPSLEKATTPSGEEQGKTRQSRSAIAVGLVDTYAAYVLLKRDHQVASSVIESYLQAGTYRQLLADTASLMSPLMTLPGVRAVRELLLPAVPAAPSEKRLADTCQAVLLEIEDEGRRRIVEWHVVTPNAYETTARCAMAIARRLRDDGSGSPGWRLPGPILLDALSQTGKPKELEFLAEVKGRRADAGT